MDPLTRLAADMGTAPMTVAPLEAPTTSKGGRPVPTLPTLRQHWPPAGGLHWTPSAASAEHLTMLWPTRL
jgi:hypothetical protein